MTRSMPQPPIHPNTLTAARLPLAPIAVVLMVSGTTWGLIGAAVLALTLELTDLADGWIARRYGAVTTFGKLFDPFSDALSRYTLFLGLFAIGVADLWMIVLIFWRDASISFLRTVAAVRNVVIASRTSGKIKAIVQGVGTQLIFITLVAMALAPELPIPASTPWWIMVVVTAVTAVSYVDYFAGNRQLLSEAWNEESD